MVGVWDSTVERPVMQLLDQIVAWLVPAMCGGAVTLAAVAARYGHAVIHGLRVLLRAEIMAAHNGPRKEKP